MADHQKPSKTVVTMVDNGHHFAWASLHLKYSGKEKPGVGIRIITSSPKGNDAHLRAIIQSEKNGSINFSDV